MPHLFLVALAAASVGTTPKVRLVEQWRVSIPESARLSVSGGFPIISANDQTLILEPSTGKTRWRLPAYQTGRIGNGWFVGIAVNNRFDETWIDGWKLGASSRKWRRVMPGGLASLTEPLGAKFFLATNGAISRISLPTGKVEESVRPETMETYTPAPSSIFVSRDWVYVDWDRIQMNYLRPWNLREVKTHYAVAKPVAIDREDLFVVSNSHYWLGRLPSAGPGKLRVFGGQRSSANPRYFRADRQAPAIFEDHIVASGIVVKNDARGLQVASNPSQVAFDRKTFVQTWQVHVEASHPVRVGNLVGALVARPLGSFFDQGEQLLQLRHSRTGKLEAELPMPFSRSYPDLASDGNNLYVHANGQVIGVRVIRSPKRLSAKANRNQR